MSRALAAVLCLAALWAGGCSPIINILPDHGEPLKEYALRGAGPDKVLLVFLRGFISSAPRRGLLRNGPSPVQELVARLDKAREDKGIKAVVVAVDSPGGTVTDSDVLYHEIRAFREATGKPVAAQIMNVGASGGYYAALAADAIYAHPTSITGSIGVIFISPKLAGLMDKIGIAAEVTKSGPLKDIGSPFRASTEEERRTFQAMIDEMAGRFKRLTAERRGLSEERQKAVFTGAVFTGEQALGLGLADGLGYLEDAARQALRLAGGSGEPKIVAYRRAEVKDDSLYNTFSAEAAPTARLVDLGPAEALADLQPGFYYLWEPGGFAP